MRRVLLAVSLVLPCVLLAASCERRSPAGPTFSAPLDQFVQALRRQGFTVNLAGEIPPEVNRFFSVPVHLVRMNDVLVNAFVYENAGTAAAEAALISQEGQPNPKAMIDWVSTPRFYRQEALIVLYVGCAAEIVQALEATVGAPIAVGRTPCDRGR